MEVRNSDVGRALRGTLASERRIGTLRLELDYQLLTLWDAMQADDKVTAANTKVRLRKIRRELLQLEAL